VTVPGNFPRVRNSRRTRSIVAASIVGVAFTFVLVLFVVRFASERPNEVNLGQDRFEVGSAHVFARAIARDGPILFKDPLTSRPGREIYVQHLGDDETEGWLAIAAYGVDAPREQRCTLVWDRAERVFTDPCGGPDVPADGTGVATFPGKVDDRRVVVIDLRSER
jgi:hypothetical protein